MGNFVGAMKEVVKRAGEKIFEKWGKKIVITGMGLVAAGTSSAFAARRENKKALEISEQTREKYNLSEKEVNKSLDLLEKLRIKVAKSFDLFADAIERIQNRPRGLSCEKTEVRLPEFNLEELKQISDFASVAMSGGSGAIAGGMAGIALFGLSSVAVAPAVLVGGVAMCGKGFVLLRSAIKNKEDARREDREVLQIVENHKKIKGAADVLYRCMKKVKVLYDKHLAELCKLTAENQRFDTYSREEQLMVQNTILLVQLLKDMCMVGLVVDSEDSNSLKAVNDEAVKEIVSKATNTLQQIEIDFE